ncbi:MAG: MATE family efflux transporter [Nannocystaceae bacterium]|nr:MATE family efflux transporter [Nannocystaceae bacterium]
MSKRDGQRRKTILVLAMPIIGGMVSQNVLNLVDTAMVGTLGDQALAAVGTGSFANFLAIAFITGLSAGVQAMVARRLGAGRTGEVAVPLNGALILAVMMAVPASIILYQLVPVAFPVLNRDPAVVAAGVPYLQARLVAMTAVGANFAFRGYWNGVNMSQMYLRTLLLMHATNILLNWLLIFGNLGFPELGATGAGVASAVATYVGTAYYIVLALRHARPGGFLRSLPSATEIRTMLRLSVPNGLQQTSMAGSLVMLFWIINQLGASSGEVATAQVAAANVVINVTLVALLPGLGLGITAASLVGQALGRRDPEDARRWGWDVARVSAVVLGILGLPMLLAPDLILGVFLHDPATLDLARGPLRLVGAVMAIDGVGLVFMNSLLGAGASRTVMLVAVAVQWLLFLPAVYVVGPLLGGDLIAIWVVQTGYRVVLAVVMLLLWRRGAWQSIEV